MKRELMTEEHLNQEVTIALRVRDLLRLGSDMPALATDTQPVLVEGTPSGDLPAIGTEWGGGIYAGVTLDGDRLAALVLLPGEAEDVNWKNAQEWAAKQGGVLPSRHDQLVLFRNVKKEFKERWYWSSEQAAGDAGCAWGQTFAGGDQYASYVSCTGRARAVRRITIR